MQVQVHHIAKNAEEKVISSVENQNDY